MPPIELRGPRNTITVEMAAKGTADVGVALLASVAPAILTGVFLTTGAPATATATVYAPEVSYGATVETGGPATATATVYAPDVSYGAEATTGAPATATATVYAPDVAVSAGVVTGPPAAATATVYAPTVSYGQTITTGAPATATATVYAPEVDAGVAVSVTSGAPATATATVHAPDVSYGQSLTTGAPATATATVYAPTVAAGGASFTPADLFAASEAGYFLDFAAGNVFTDTSRATAATDTDTVAGATDLSGNGNHFQQPTSGQRPQFNSGTGGYLQLDGVDDHLERLTEMSLGEEGITLFAAVRKEDDSGSGVILLSRTVDYQLFTDGPDYTVLFKDHGASGFDRRATSSAPPQPHEATLVGYTDGVGGAAVLRQNGVESSGLSIDRTGAPSSEIYIGSNLFGQVDYGGRIYAVGAIGRVLTAQEISDLETWCNARRGA